MMGDVEHALNFKVTLTLTHTHIVGMAVPAHSIQLHHTWIYSNCFGNFDQIVVPSTIKTCKRGTNWSITTKQRRDSLPLFIFHAPSAWHFHISLKVCEINQFIHSVSLNFFFCFDDKPWNVNDVWNDVDVLGESMNVTSDRNILLEHSLSSSRNTDRFLHSTTKHKHQHSSNSCNSHDECSINYIINNIMMLLLHCAPVRHNALLFGRSCSIAALYSWCVNFVCVAYCVWWNFVSFCFAVHLKLAVWTVVCGGGGDGGNVSNRLVSQNLHFICQYIFIFSVSGFPFLADHFNCVLRAMFEPLLFHLRNCTTV